MNPMNLSVPCYRYDVFLSFRGVDTRKGIIFNLYDELQRAGGIRTFKDDEGLEIGMPISPNLLRAIEESRFVIVVLSSNYADSEWCLDELVSIFRCKEGKDRILPLFYNVDPSDKRNQRGSFGVALSQFEENPLQDLEQVKQWRIALSKVGNLSGWDTRNYRSEKELVKHIVEFVCSKLRKESARVPEVPRRVAIEDEVPEVSRLVTIEDEVSRLVTIEDESLVRFGKKHFSVGPYGSNKGGESFDDGVHSTVRQLVISYDKHGIDHIQIEYDSEGDSLWSEPHGNTTKDQTTVTLDYPDEYLTSMHGCYEKVWNFPTVITSLSFTSNKKTYGPFGGGYGPPVKPVNFSINVPNSKIVGFHGRSSGLCGLYAIGAHLQPLDC